MVIDGLASGVGLNGVKREKRMTVISRRESLVVSQRVEVDATFVIRHELVRHGDASYRAV